MVLLPIRDMALWFADIAADGTEPEERKRRWQDRQGREQVTEYEGVFGIEKADWENEPIDFLMIWSIINHMM